MKALNASPWHFPGALSSGPNQSPDATDISYPGASPYAIWGYFGDPALPRSASTPVDGRFTDNDSWSTNEVAINWNAALLYNLYAARSFAHQSGPTGIEGTHPSTPVTFRLDQNYPNPFNGSTLIPYALPRASRVRIEVFDLLGRSVATLVNGLMAAGEHRALFRTASLPSGVYYCRMVTEEFTATRRLQLLK
jgi:hypothetical protein